ncbi:MAG: transmembrane anchor protein [Rhizobiales bacterium NRL2]|jgi:hypothetical protein|nr:MAG: transmembrane anchor protein [Rhizobiales bacterium NRL2]
MFNAEKPSLEELPSSRQLLRSTLLAALSALAILIAVVLPAEYGIDPTGAGRVLGLTEMGEIKQELEKEAEQDGESHGGADQSSNPFSRIVSLFISTANAQESWRDTVTFTLEPGEYTEMKLAMAEGNFAEYAWNAEGGRINYDLHAHGGGESVTYEKGRGKTSGDGSFTAPFPGNHGWFWRNRDSTPITVTLKIRGDYSELVRSN